MLPSKEKIKHIKELKDSNKEKKYIQYRTFYKTYKSNPRPITSIYPGKKKPNSKNDINTLFTMTCNSNSPLNTFYNTFYSNSPNKTDQNLTTKGKKYFGLDGNTPLPYFNGTQYSNISKIDFLKTQNSNNPTFSNYNITQYSLEDELLVQNAFYNLNQPRRILDKDTVSEIYQRYNIEKQLTESERLKIDQTLRPFSSNKIKAKNYYGIPKNNGIFFEVRGNVSYKTPYKAYKTIKLNNQLSKKVEEIRNMRQFQLYQEQFEKAQTRRIKTAKMPHIKVVNKAELKLAEKRNQKIQELMDYNNIPINTGDVPKSSEIRYNKDGQPLTREEILKEIEIEIRYIGASYHPETRTLFSLAYGEGSIFIYGGLAGRKLGDLWACDIINKKSLIWKKLYDNPYVPKRREKKKEEEMEDQKLDNNYSFESEITSSEENKDEYKPLPRYGHTMHFYKHKLYIIGGYFHNWKKNPKNETLLIIYDLINGKWYKDNAQIKEKELNTTNSTINRTFNSNIFQDINYEANQNNNSNSGPCLRKNHVSLLIGSQIFLYGGVNQNEIYLGDCWVYNLRVPGWSVVEISGRIPPALGFHCCTLGLEKEQLYNPKLTIYKVPESTRKTVPVLKCEGVFFFGGMNDNRKPTNLFFVMKLGKKQMEFEIPKTFGEPPSPRISASIDFYPNLNFLILHGGRNDLIEHSFMNDFYVLDLETMHWIKALFVKDIPIERAEHKSLIFGNKLLILGGVNMNSFMNFDFSITNLDFI